MAETTEFRGFVIRASKGGDGVASHLASYKVWFADRFEGAWVHLSVPTEEECADWETKPTDFCAATWSSSSGNQKAGDWTPWPPESTEGGG